MKESPIEKVKTTVRRINYGVTVDQVEALTFVDNGEAVLEELRACGVVRRDGDLYLPVN